jgi:transposase
MVLKPDASTRDLIADHGFVGSYQSVKRFVRKLRKRLPERVHRMECEPGQEAQIDFGKGAPIVDENGRRRGTSVFRIVLSFSRKAYSEAVLRQDSESFLRCLENAFRHFGGVPATLCPDNLKAAVTRADWHDPEINPKLEAFSRHYGTTVLPSRPYRPTDKGKVESSVKYVKNNALKARVFGSLQEQNLHLRQWEEQVADKRIHGTVCEQVQKRFERAEKAALKPLPGSLFPSYQEALRTVHRDSYIAVANAYYQVPEEFIGREVWAQWDGRFVRVFDKRMQPIVSHTRTGPGRFSSCLGAGGHKESSEKTLAYWQRKAGYLGPHCGQWARAVGEHRGAQAIRTLQGLCALHRKHRPTDLDAACQAALSRQAWTLAEVRTQLERRSTQVVIDFAQQHELIRSMSEYGHIAGNPFAE